MTAANVLEAHKLIMEKYDEFLLFTLMRNSKDPRNKYKELCINSAHYASSKCKDLDGVKIKAASKAAYEIAFKRFSEMCVEELLTSKNQEEFKKRYDAALRVQLYCKFFGHDVKAFLDKFESENPENERNLASSMIALLEDVEKNIKLEFSKFEIIQSAVNVDDLQIIIGLKEGLDGLLGEFKKYFNETLSANSLNKRAKIAVIQDLVFQFQMGAGGLIRGYQIKTESKESWAPFLLNMLLLVTVIGVLPVLYSFGTKAVTGQYAFFDKSTVRKTSVEEMAPEDKLLAFNQTEIDEDSEEEIDEGVATEGMQNPSYCG
jgi:hypothetical protein